MTVTQLDMDDLDEDDLAALAEVKKKGYYHARPKSVPPPPPQRVAIPADAPVVKRAEIDAFQRKWDKWDDDHFVESSAAWRPGVSLPAGAGAAAADGGGSLLAPAAVSQSGGGFGGTTLLTSKDSAPHARARPRSAAWLRVSGTGLAAVDGAYELKRLAADGSPIYEQLEGRKALYLSVKTRRWFVGHCSNGAAQKNTGWLHSVRLAEPDDSPTFATAWRTHQDGRWCTRAAVRVEAYGSREQLVKEIDKQLEDLRVLRETMHAKA